MKKYIAYLLATCALLTACQPAKIDENPPQIVKTLIHSNNLLYKNIYLLLDKIESTAEVKKQFTPLAILARQMQKQGYELKNQIDNGIKYSKMDYIAVFEKYEAFGQTIQNDMLALQTDSSTSGIKNFNLKKEQLATLFAQSPLLGQRQKQLSQAEFEQLKGVDLQIYLLTWQQDLIAGINEVLNFLGDRVSLNGYPIYYSYQILSSPEKPAIFLGEEYKAEIRLAPYYEKPTNFTLQINGDSLAICAEKAVYTHRPDKVGEQSYRAAAVYKDPVTGELIKVSQDFRYEVLPAKAKK